MIGRSKTCSGFTLVEVMFSVIILGIIASTITIPFISGFQSLEVQADQIILDSHLRSQMEELISRPFDEVLAEGANSETVTVNGNDYTLNWAAVLIDLDGDSVTELDAMQVTVVMEHRSLTTILVNNQGRVGTLP